MIEPDTATALNTTRPTDTLGIFKPFAHRLDNEPELISDADEEIIVSINSLIRGGHKYVIARRL
jgi:hypothetical protein